MELGVFKGLKWVDLIPFYFMVFPLAHVESWTNKLFFPA